MLDYTGALSYPRTVSCESGFKGHRGVKRQNLSRRRMGSQEGWALSWVHLSGQGSRPEKKLAELSRHKPKAGISPGIADF